MKNLFNQGFYKFLLSFSLIIIASFGALFLISLHLDNTQVAATEVSSGQ